MGKNKRIQSFLHDTDMRNDVKVRALRKRYGHEGYAIWCFILETLTDTDELELEMNELTIELLAADFDTDPTKLQDIIDFMVRIHLLQNEDGKVYSERHQERLESSLARFGYLRQLRSDAGMASAASKKAAKEEQETNKNQQDFNKSQQDFNKSQQDFNKNQQTTNKSQQDATNRIEYNRIEYNDTLVVAPRFDFDKIAQIWNGIIKKPRVAQLTEDRRKKIKSRLEEWKCKTQDEAEHKAEELFKKIQASDFLTGRSGDWTANFDWVFGNEKNYLKVLEGNYDNRGAGSAQAANGSLGDGEFMTPDGRRTYGTGKANIPLDAPARPSDRYSWDGENQKWIMI